MVAVLGVVVVVLVLFWQKDLGLLMVLGFLYEGGQECNRSLLTNILNFMLQQPPGYIFADLNELPWHEPRLCPSLSLCRTIIDECHHPPWMLRSDSTPKEVFVGAKIASPFIRQSFKHTWQPCCLGIDVPH